MLCPGKMLSPAAQWGNLACKPWLFSINVMLTALTSRFTAGVATELAKGGVNVSYMTVTRAAGDDAIMAIGVDGNPPASVLEAIPSVPGIIEFTVFSESGIQPLG